ncbi:MAG: hypothetical protein AVDCRST_MAG18-608, partial [uncultured Thermomicrobiales bacterium]
EQHNDGTRTLARAARAGRAAIRPAAGALRRGAAGDGRAR